MLRKDSNLGTLRLIKRLINDLKRGDPFDSPNTDAFVAGRWSDRGSGRII